MASVIQNAVIDFVSDATLTGGVKKDSIEMSFAFDIITSHQMVADSDITDHYVEDGSSLQDHIALRPITFTLRGFCAEKVYIGELPPITSKLSSGASKLQPLQALFPTVSSYCQTVVAASSYVESVVDKYVKIAQNIKDKVKDFNSLLRPAAVITRQEVIANELMKLREARVLCNLTSPWGFYQNMALQSIQLVQDETTSQSEIIIELKQMNFAHSLLTSVDASAYKSRLQQQMATNQDLGNIQGVTKESVLHQILHGGGNAMQGLLKGLVGI